MTKLKRKLKTPKGFMIIIALIMFAIMSYWAIAAMKRNIQTITNTKNTNLYYRATDIADSMMEYLQYTIKKEHDSGYNLDVECDYNNGATPSDPLCATLLTSTGLVATGDKVEVKLTIKGRSYDGTMAGTIDEQFQNCRLGSFPYGCYVVPFAGTGDASEKCNGYKPDFNNLNSINSDGGIVAAGSTAELCPRGDGIDCIKQLDYACNWNKLQFGSSLLDRAVVPFYYDNGQKDVNGNSEIVNPFNTAEQSGTALAKNFVLRVRTPCKPCDKRSNTACSSDPTICADDDRYALSATETNDPPPNDIVVQWQLTGKCGTEECGLIQYNKPDDSYNSSAITESRINNGDDIPGFAQHVVLTKNQQGLDTNSYSESTRPSISEQLKSWTKPILSLFLGEKLKTPETDNDFVPYLEYQVLADKPIANPSIKLEVFASVDGIGVRKTMYKEEQKQLIDFAVQN